MLNGCLIRDVMENDLDMLLQWRNHPEVRRFMFTQHEISPEEHSVWFAKSRYDVNRRLLIVEDENNPIGYIQFNNASAKATSDWGFYAKPNAPKGTGRKMGTIALDYAFDRLKLHKVCGQAIGSNKASIALHLGLGFTLENVVSAFQMINKTNQSLHCFGLLASEWAQKKTKGN